MKRGNSIFGGLVEGGSSHVPKAERLVQLKGREQEKSSCRVRGQTVPDPLSPV